MSTSHLLLPHAVSYIIPEFTHCSLWRIRHLPHMPPFGTCTRLKRVPIVSSCISSLPRFSHVLNSTSLRLLMRIKLCNAQHAETTKHWRYCLYFGMLLKMGNRAFKTLKHLSITMCNEECPWLNNSFPDFGCLVLLLLNSWAWYRVALCGGRNDAPMEYPESTK